MDAQTLRSRIIRECILRLLHNTFRANPDVGVLATHIFQGFGTGLVQYTQAEIEAELADLADDKLITVENAPGLSAVPQKLFRSTSRGRDFARANFPWGRVDEYTGEQKP